jgi:hypothetical protein
MMRNTARSFGTASSAMAVARSQAYASAGDFCAIFREDSDSLYTLGLSLTASHKLAYETFMAALQNCHDGSTVFQEWARPWSRRAVIKSAIHLLEPIRSEGNEQAKVELEAIAAEMDPSARSFLLLGKFERLAFVISVLEGYTVRECAALLNAGPREVEQARVQALQKIAGEQNILPASYVNSSETAANSIFAQS